MELNRTSYHSCFCVDRSMTMFRRETLAVFPSHIDNEHLYLR